MSVCCRLILAVCVSVAPEFGVFYICCCLSLAVSVIAAASRQQTMRMLPHHVTRRYLPVLPAVFARLVLPLHLWAILVQPDAFCVRCGCCSVILTHCLRVAVPLWLAAAPSL